MDINVTLFGEILTFSVLVWVTMKYVWPPILKVMQERQQKIAQGLEAAERGRHSLDLAQEKISEQLHEAKNNAATIINQATAQAMGMIEAAKAKAQEEGEKLLHLAKANIQQEIMQSKQELRRQTAILALQIAEKILQTNMNEKIQKELIEELIKEI